MVHLGGFNNADESKTGPEGERLYQVKGYNFLDTRAVQVRTTTKSLNSGDSFVLISTTQAIIWQGKLCSDDERYCATNIATKLAEGKAVVTIEEGQEDDEFWKKLGGKTTYPNAGDIGPVERAPRLFQISDSTTGGRGITVSEIFEFHQEDLIDDDVMLLDTHKEIYLWIGRNARKNEEIEADALAKNYLKELNRRNGRDLQTAVSTVRSGSEPPTFTCYFLGWDDTQMTGFVDPYKRKLKRLVTEQKVNSELARLASDRRRKFVDPRVSSKIVSSTTSTPSNESKTEFKFKPLVDFFTLKELVGMKSEDGIDATRKEDYLTDEEFESVFGMTRDKFKEVAKWRQNAKKQELGLY